MRAKHCQAERVVFVCGLAIAVGLLCRLQLSLPHGTASNGATLQSVDFGSIYSFSYYFNKYVGVQLEADEHIPNDNA